MRGFIAEFALLSIQGKVADDDPEYIPLDEAWQILRDEVARGDAPDDLGNDIEKWAAWVDHKYTRLHRIACGTASFRLVGPATATGRFVNQSGGHSFAQVVISVVPTTDRSQLVIDNSHCTVPYSYQPDAAEKESYLAAVADGIQAYATRNRLIGMTVSVLEIHVHPIDSSPRCFEIAAASAMHEVVAIAGKVAI